MDITINGTEYTVNDRLNGFSLDQKKSSNVDFFGTNLTTKELFIQFKNGFGYIYSDVPIEVLSEIHKAESIGKFFASQVSGKYETALKSPTRLITFVDGK